MAKTIIARPNQSMMDIVLMACGTLEGSLQFCVANDVSISELPEVGREYIIPDGITTDVGILNEIETKKILIGTLSLGVCAVVTGVAVDEETITHDSAEIAYVVGTDGVGVQWRFVGDEEWEDATGSPLVLEELEAETEYRVQFRTRCLENYSAPVSVNFETAEAPPSLEANIILKPSMQVLLGMPYLLALARYTPTFIHVYDLLPDWLNNTPMQTEDMSHYAVDFGAGATVVNRFSGTMVSTVSNYGSQSPAIPGDYRMVFINDLTGAELGLPAAELTHALRDVNGNTARETPLVFIADSWLTVDAKYLIPDINIETLSASDTEVVIRITRSHAATGLGFISLDSMGWGVPVGYTLAVDPLEPLNNNKKIATLTPGTYTVLVTASYTGSPIPDWPNSQREIVIEVAVP